MDAAAARAPARWRLVCNCRVLGLANCTSVAAPSIALDFPRFRRNPAESPDRIGEYGLVATAPQLG